MAVCGLERHLCRLVARSTQSFVLCSGQDRDTQSEDFLKSSASEVTIMSTLAETIRWVSRRKPDR
jgi:hypothetical protein